MPLASLLPLFAYFLIGFLLYLGGFIIPIVPWIFVSGYVAKVIKQTIDAGEYYLPEWDDWRDIGLKGLQVTGITFLVLLPILGLFFCGYAAMLMPAFADISASQSYGDELAPFFGLTPLAGMLSGMCLFGLSIIFALSLGLLVPPAIGHMLAEGKFGSAFRVREWWPVFTANIGGYLIAYILLMGTTFLLVYAIQLMYMTIVLCCAIPFVMSLISFYVGVFSGALFGQSYRVGKGNTVVGLIPDEAATAGAEHAY